MITENKILKQAWADIVITAKFFLSSLGLTGAACVVGYNFNLFNFDFPRWDGRKK